MIVAAYVMLGVIAVCVAVVIGSLAFVLITGFVTADNDDAYRLVARAVRRDTDDGTAA